jgi:hypothetical protein
MVLKSSLLSLRLAEVNNCCTNETADVGQVKWTIGIGTGPEWIYDVSEAKVHHRLDYSMMV